jgi:uncharacterized membrane protein YphA (DoxX/SURF4 family)
MAGMNGTTRISRLPAAAFDGRPPARPRSRRLGLVLVLLMLGCRYFLAAVFLAAAVTKITDLRAFADYLVLHSGLPTRLALTVAAALPWLELVCAACLLFRRAVRESAAILALLLVFFLCYSLIHLQEPDCGCFLFPGPRSAPRSHWILARDLLLLLASLAVTFQGAGSRIREQPGSKSVSDC